jgi:hypothetical protein
MSPCTFPVHSRSELPSCTFTLLVRFATQSFVSDGTGSFATRTPSLGSDSAVDVVRGVQGSVVSGHVAEYTPVAQTHGEAPLESVGLRVAEEGVQDRVVDPAGPRRALCERVER